MDGHMTCRHCNRRFAGKYVVMVASLVASALLYHNIAGARSTTGSGYFIMDSAITSGLRGAQDPSKAGHLNCTMLHLERGPKMAGQLNTAETESVGKKTVRLPDVLVIGGKKCGTGTLKNFLSHHPKIAGDDAEVHFFDHDDKYSNGLEWYRHCQYEAGAEQRVMEGSPAYFHMPFVPERVHRMNESIKLILILRDPLARLVSDYVHTKARGVPQLRHYMPTWRIREMEASHNPNTFPEFDWLMFDKNGLVDTTLQLVKTGLYAVHLKRYLQYFTLDQIHVVDGAKFAQAPWKELSAIEHFLNINPFFTQDSFQFNSTKGFYCIKGSNELQCMTATKGSPHPGVNPVAIDRLRAFYKPYNEELYKILGMRFDW